MTEYEVGPLSAGPYGERVGRVICTSGGGVIAWIMKANNEVRLARPPTKAPRRSPLRMCLTPLEAQPGFVAVECPNCGTHEVNERQMFNAVSNGQRNAVIEV